MSEEPRITVDIAVRCGFCAMGMRRWCREHGFDLRDFIENGMAISDIPPEYQDNELVLRMIRVARGEEDL